MRVLKLADLHSAQYPWPACYQIIVIHLNELEALEYRTMRVW